MYVIAYDVGTTGLKTCLFDIDEEKKIIRFDVVLSFDITHDEAIRVICEEIRQKYPEYNPVIVPDIDITD
jgi:sugar (pentulose or hexulose) kinase